MADGLPVARTGKRRRGARIFIGSAALNITAHREHAMTLAELTETMKSRGADRQAFGNTVKFATPDGVIHIDGNQSPPAITNEDGPADCTIKMSLSDLVDLIGGKLDGMTAFMTGKLKIDGDMGVAMKLQSILR